jgi:hypothetical protein
MAHLFKIEEPFKGYINLDTILYIKDNGPTYSIYFNNNTEIYVTRSVGKELLLKCYLVNENDLIYEY